MPCSHPTTELRKDKRVGGGLRVVRQCMKCGERLGRAIPSEKYEGDPRPMRWFDRRLARKPQPGKRKRDYAARFKAPDWAVKRRIVLARDNETCFYCGERATEVHHKSYEGFVEREEKLSQLVAVCGPCNRDERERRIALHVLGGT